MIPRTLADVLLLTVMVVLGVPTRLPWAAAEVAVIIASGLAGRSPSNFSNRLPADNVAEVVSPSIVSAAARTPVIVPTEEWTFPYHVKVVVFGFSEGQELSEHTASRPAILQVVRGQAKVTLGDSEMTVGEGGWFYLCPKQPHAIVAQKPLALMLVLTRP